MSCDFPGCRETEIETTIPHLGGYDRYCFRHASELQRKDALRKIAARMMGAK